MPSDRVASAFWSDLVSSHNLGHQHQPPQVDRNIQSRPRGEISGVNQLHENIEKPCGQFEGPLERVLRPEILNEPICQDLLIHGWKFDPGFSRSTSAHPFGLPRVSMTAESCDHRLASEE